jgi:hypothetical protein
VLVFFNEVEVPFFAAVDVFLWAVSIVGRVPSWVDLEKYCLRLAFLAQKWLRLCVQSNRKMPRTVQITYLEHGAGVTLQNPSGLLNVALGATMCPGTTKRQVAPLRYAFLQDISTLNVPDPDHSFVTYFGQPGQNFGACAETYPLILLFR